MFVDGTSERASRSNGPFVVVSCNAELCQLPSRSVSSFDNRDQSSDIFPSTPTSLGSIFLTLSSVVAQFGSHLNATWTLLENRFYPKRIPHGKIRNYHRDREKDSSFFSSQSCSGYSSNYDCSVIADILCIFKTHCTLTWVKHLDYTDNTIRLIVNVTTRVPCTFITISILQGHH